MKKQTVYLYETLQFFYQENQFWSPPDNKSKSTSQKNLTCSLKSSDQQPDSQEMLIQKFESTKIDKVQENPRDENQQPIRYLVVPFVCPNKLCNWIVFSSRIQVNCVCACSNSNSMNKKLQLPLLKSNFAMECAHSWQMKTTKNIPLYHFLRCKYLILVDRC